MGLLLLYWRLVCPRARRQGCRRPRTPLCTGRYDEHGSRARIACGSVADVAFEEKLHACCRHSARLRRRKWNGAQAGTGCRC